MCVKLILVLLAVITCVNADDCPKTSSITATTKLKNAITCDYDSMMRPVANHKNTTSVYFKLMLKYFTYDVTTSTMSLDVWMPTFWKDEHLKWKPADYENIESIRFHTYQIWTPDLSVFNRANQGDEPTTLGNTICSIQYTGNVLCVPSLHIEALCVPDLSMYPFDTQRCAVRFGSWVHKGEEVDIKLTNNVLVTKETEPNGEWEIANYTAKRYPGNYKCCPNATYPSVEVTFNIKRLSGAHAASVVIPTIVATILTFTALSLSPVNPDRLILCYINVIIQFMHVEYVSWQVPLKGDKIPLLLLFARDSMLLAALLIVFTFINKKIMQKLTTAPSPVSVIVSGVVGNRVGQFIFLNDNHVKGIASANGDEDTVEIIKSNASKASESWVLFGRILDFILLIIYVIVYFTMFMKFIP